MTTPTSRIVVTPRRATHIWESGAGTPVLFVHGNLSDGAVWHEQQSLLPAGFHGVAVDLRGFGGGENPPIDATRGVGDHRDDLHALCAALGFETLHLVGHSMGGGIVADFAAHYPKRVRSLTLVAPVSPDGFGGTGSGGVPNHPDHAGSGGGAANPELIRRVGEGDRSADHQLSPRNVIANLYFPGAEHVRDEKILLDGILATRLGEDHYPGDSRPSENWPGFAPGTRGVLNSIAPEHFSWRGLAPSGCTAPVLWVRGDADVIISDTSLSDIGHLGAIGAVPGWPGAGTYPAQPMVAQTRGTLDSYGAYREVVFDGVGHFPQTQRPGEFAALLHEHLRGAS